MPGTTFCVQNATCSVSAKKLSTMRSSTSRPTRRIGRTSSGILCRVQDVEVERVRELVVEELQAELPLRIVALGDGVPQVASVEVGVRAVDLDRLVPRHGLHAELRL